MINWTSSNLQKAGQHTTIYGLTSQTPAETRMEKTKMTRIYFIRHAEPDFNVQDDFSRPLTPKSESDRTLVEEFLADKNIDVALSSPFKRAFDTVETFARKANLKIRTIDDFRERKVDDAWIKPFEEFTGKQWADFSYKLPAGESLSEVQNMA